MNAGEGIVSTGDNLRAVAVGSSQSMSVKANRRIYGENIRVRRLTLRLYQKDVAEALGTSEARISRIETGESGLFFEEINKLCEVLSIEDPKVLSEQDYFIR
jgi:DNA-binding Xre family transcriptional regulator